MQAYNIPNRTAPPLNRGNLSSLNKKITQPINRNTVMSLNTQSQNRQQSTTRTAPQQARPAPQPQARPAPPPRPAPQTRPAPQPRPTPQPAPQSAPAPRAMRIPTLVKPLRKGQKTPVSEQGASRLRACVGWNVSDARCDIDASAFLVNASNRVPGDEWFVFYGQTQSPDGSVRFQEDPSLQDREVLSIDLGRLSPDIQKIIFVLTIHEAFAQKLNFSMIQDAYLRLMDAASGQELLSYRLEECYDSVTSMTIGELYRHNGQWKFNPVGNGVNQDLAGQCAIYGVEIC